MDRFTLLQVQARTAQYVLERVQASQPQWKGQVTGYRVTLPNAHSSSSMGGQTWFWNICLTEEWEALNSCSHWVMIVHQKREDWDKKVIFTVDTFYGMLKSGGIRAWRKCQETVLDPPYHPKAWWIFISHNVFDGILTMDWWMSKMFSRKTGKPQQQRRFSKSHSGKCWR